MDNVGAGKGVFNDITVCGMGYGVCDKIDLALLSTWALVNGNYRILRSIHGLYLEGPDPTILDRGHLRH